MAAGGPEPLTLTGDPAGPAFRGRYLHVRGRPLALGRMIGQGDEAMVYELIDLREGICTNVVKICRYAPGTPRYQRWAVPVRDERSPYASLPDVERRPALLVEVRGGLVKIQPYLAADRATAWTTPFPAMVLYRSAGHFGVGYALSLAAVLLAKHGPRGVLLEAKAVLLWQANRKDEAATVMEEAVLALSAEHHPSRFAANCRLAEMLRQSYHSRPYAGDLVMTLNSDDGTAQLRQQIFTSPEEAAADDAAQDRPTMLLLEVLAEEPYLVRCP